MVTGGVDCQVIFQSLLRLEPARIPNSTTIPVAPYPHRSPVQFCDSPYGPLMVVQASATKLQFWTLGRGTNQRREAAV